MGAVPYPEADPSQRGDVLMEVTASPVGHDAPSAQTVGFVDRTSRPCPTMARC